MSIRKAYSFKCIYLLLVIDTHYIVAEHYVTLICGKGWGE